MNALLTRSHYRKLPTEQLCRQYRRFERGDDNRRFMLGEISDVLAERGVRP